MKMEVLSVQNQYQGQFGVIGSTKVKDWTSPLTPPPPPPSHKRSNNLNNSNSNNSLSGDVADARQPANNHYYHNQQHQQLQQQQQQKQQQPLQYEHHYDQAAMKAVGAANAGVVVDGSAAASYAYNNNLLCCEPAPLPLSTAATARFGAPTNDIDANAVNELSQRLQAELRAAKSRHLACTEVSLPWDLTPRIAAEIIKTSEREPCGVRGCSIYIEFEDEPNNTRRIASYKVDPDTVSTFELYLTLRQDKSGWTSLLPQFLKNLTRSNTILISPDFTLTKNKLYSCD